MAGSILYGFHQLADVFDQRVTQVGLDVVNTAIQQAVTERNRQLNAMTDLFVTRTTEYSVRYQQFGRARSQPLDQNGRARPIKAAGSYTIAFPIQASGNAWGANYVTRQMMTVAEANEATRTLLDGDTEWVSDHILAALFANATWTFTDEQYGDLTIQPLANGDGVTYALFTGAAQGATDTHQYAQAGAVADAANPFPAIYTELTEHPENSGNVVALCASNLIADIQGLATFVEIADPNIQLGANSSQLVGSLGAQVPGTVKGYVDGVWIVDWPRIPSGYFIATTTGGQRPLAQREYPVASLQGFNLVGERDDHPFWEAQYARFTGFGAWNRVGAVAGLIGNASYSVPTNFTSPMP